MCGPRSGSSSVCTLESCECAFISISRLVYSLSVNNSIRVEHGDYLEDVGLSQAPCKRAGAHQELQRALHYPAGIGFSRVHSGRQEDQWAIPWGGRRRDREHSTNTDRMRKNKEDFFHLKFFTAEEHHR